MTATETVIFVFDAAGKLVAEYSTSPSETPQVQYLTNAIPGTPASTPTKTARSSHGQTSRCPTAKRPSASAADRLLTNTSPTTSAKELHRLSQRRRNQLDYAQSPDVQEELGRFTGLTRCLLDSR
ncbi:MAG: hypothetical protein IPJ30_28120 [Acidobacteria bacterium]|nr:hypothetical protein [Acidobacteriota bacterium]